MTAANVLPDPEIRPAMDEKRAVIGPNLAVNLTLARDVTVHLAENFWYPYLLLAMPFWNSRRIIDNMWRGRMAAADLTTPHVTKQTLENKTPTPIDGKSARGQSTKPFQQIHAVTDIMEQVSWDEGLPVKAMPPEQTVEDDFYQPTEQSCAAANIIFGRNSETLNLRNNYRKSAGSFAKYGLSWAMTDFSMRYESVELIFPLQDQMQADAVLQQYPDAMLVPGAAKVRQNHVAEMLTHYHPLSVDDVFIDPLITCEPMSKQPCPIVRRHVTPSDIQANAYHPVSNPFGFVNIPLAMEQQKSHYALSQVDEQPLREKLKNRYNINDQMGVKVERIKQQWTLFPLLRIGPNGELDTGEGIVCPHCAGQGSHETETGRVECPTCQGTKRVFPPLKRYMVDLYGHINSGATCIRIQEMPEGMEIPLLYGADLVEDETCSVPVSLSEIAMIAVDQLTQAETQYVDAKNSVIYRGFKFKEDSPSAKIQNSYMPNLRVPCESSMDEFERLETATYDETVTLIPYIQRLEQQIEEIFGVTPTLRGLLASGRRSALEVGEATEAAKNPLVLKTDRFNQKMMGGWARHTLKNIELFGDRDYIRRLTGREFFGNIKLFTAVGKEFFAKMAATANLRYILESSANDPSMAMVRPQIWNELLPLMGITNVRVPDGGMAKAMDDAAQIISQILGDGAFVPATPDDPHEIYVMAFKAALKTDYWKRFAPQNFPLLQQRIMQQTELQIQAEMMQMQQQMLQNQIMNPGGEEGGGNGNTPAQKRNPKDAGQASQNAQG
jgi:hypothetical protein